MSHNIKHFIDHYYIRFIQAACTVLLLVLLVLGARSSYMLADPLYGARTEYSEVTEHEELNSLISQYYQYYSSNKIRELEKIAPPVSDMEKSYIGFMSQYLKGYDVVEIFSKPGAEPGSYLVSVNVNVNFDGIDNPSPGLDFFYVRPGKDGRLIIDNRYSAFNQLYKEEETEGDIQDLYDEFEIQEDVNLLRIRIQNEYNSLIASDSKFSEFIGTTLPVAAEEWAIGYKAELDAAIAAEEAARLAAEEEAARLAQEEADRLAAEEAERLRAEEMASAVTMVTNDTVNFRDQPSQQGNVLAVAQPNTPVLKYSDEGEWSVVDFNGGKAYVRSDFLVPYVAPAE